MTKAGKEEKKKSISVRNAAGKSCRMRRVNMS